jgi:hypothetical protein
MATPATFIRAVLPTQSTPHVVTVPEGQTWAITSVVLANAHSAPVQVAMYVDGFLLVPAYELRARNILSFDLKTIATEGEDISLWASVDAVVTAHISGVQSDGFL